MLLLRGARDRSAGKEQSCFSLLPIVELELFAAPYILVWRDRGCCWNYLRQLDPDSNCCLVGATLDSIEDLALEASQERVVRHWLAAIFAAFGYFDLIVVLVVARRDFGRVKTDSEVVVVRV
jgi:hypothetical protein